MEMISHADITLSRDRIALGVEGDSPSILLMDSDWDSRSILSGLLGAAGYRVLWADSVRTAAELAKHHAFALIITESRDAQGHIGLVAATRAEPALADLPIIVHTSWVLPVDRITAAEHGVIAFLEKPCDHRVLLPHVERAVRAADDAGLFAQPYTL